MCFSIVWGVFSLIQPNSANFAFWADLISQLSHWIVGFCLRGRGIRGCFNELKTIKTDCKVSTMNYRCYIGNIDFKWSCFVMFARKQIDQENTPKLKNNFSGTIFSWNFQILISNNQENFHFFALKALVVSFLVLGLQEIPPYPPYKNYCFTPKMRFENLAIYKILVFYLFGVYFCLIKAKIAYFSF